MVADTVVGGHVKRRMGARANDEPVAGEDPIAGDVVDVDLAARPGGQLDRVGAVGRGRRGRADHDRLAAQEHPSQRADRRLGPDAPHAPAHDGAAVGRDQRRVFGVEARADRGAAADRRGGAGVVDPDAALRAGAVRIAVERQVLDAGADQVVGSRDEGRGRGRHRGRLGRRCRARCERGREAGGDRAVADVRGQRRAVGLDIDLADPAADVGGGEGQPANPADHLGFEQGAAGERQPGRRPVLGAQEDAADIGVGGVAVGASAGLPGTRGDAPKPAVELGELAVDRVDAEVVVLGAEADQLTGRPGDDELAAMAGLVREARVGLYVGEHGAGRRPPDPGAELPEARGVGVVKGLQAGVGPAQRPGSVVIRAPLPAPLASSGSRSCTGRRRSCPLAPGAPRSARRPRQPGSRSRAAGGGPGAAARCRSGSVGERACSLLSMLEAELVRGRWWIAAVVLGWRRRRGWGIGRLG